MKQRDRSAWMWRRLGNVHVLLHVRPNGDRPVPFEPPRKEKEAHQGGPACLSCLRHPPKILRDSGESLVCFQCVGFFSFCFSLAHFTFSPAAEWASDHPNYSLLGFSACGWSPKFPLPYNSKSMVDPNDFRKYPQKSIRVPK